MLLMASTVLVHAITKCAERKAVAQWRGAQAPQGTLSPTRSWVRAVSTAHVARGLRVMPVCAHCMTLWINCVMCSVRYDGRRGDDTVNGVLL